MMKIQVHGPDAWYEANAYFLINAQIMDGRYALYDQAPKDRQNRGEPVGSNL